MQFVHLNTYQKATNKDIFPYSTLIQKTPLISQNDYGDVHQLGIL